MRVALFLGLPATEEEYLRRAGEGMPAGRSDYLAKFDAPDASPADRLDHLRGWWGRRYEADVAVPLQRLAAAARGFGCCRVVQAARLNDLEAIADGVEALVIVGHWKGPELENDDFSPTFDAVAAARIGEIDHPLARWIAAAVAPKRGLSWLFGSALSLRDALRAGLDADIDEGIPDGVDSFVEHPQTRRSRRRDLFDAWFEGVLAPGNRLELFDGLHAKEAVAEALCGFEGIVDLTTCTSTYLGDYLFLRSAGRCHTVQFLTVQEPVDFAMRLAATLDLVCQGYDYLAARKAVGEAANAMAG